MKVVVDSSKTVILFVGYGFHYFIVNILLEFVNIFLFVSEDLNELRVVSPFPVGNPGNFKHFILTDQIFMDKLEMEHVSSVFRNVLDMTLDVVYGLTTVRVLMNPFLIVKHQEVGLYGLICVNPYVNEGI